MQYPCTKSLPIIHFSFQQICKKKRNFEFLTFMSKLILGNDDLFPSILEERVLDDLIGFLGSFVGVQFCKGGGKDRDT